MKQRISKTHRHALDQLGELADGAYFVVVCDGEVTNAPFVAPPRGAAFMVEGKWMVFSPVEYAN